MTNRDKPVYAHRCRGSDWTPKQRLAMGIHAANRHRGEVKVSLSSPPWEVRAARGLACLGDGKNQQKLKD